MTKDEALKMAIKALELCDGNGLKDYDFCIAIHKCKTALIACKEALEQPAQEPVAWVCGGELYLTKEAADDSKRDWSLVPIPLYTHPAQPCQDLNNIKELLAQRNLELLEVQGKLLKVTLQKEVIERDYNFMRDLAIGLEEGRPAQKPLSDDEITKAVLAIPVTFPSIFGIARAIEKAHGIGE